MYGMGVHSNKGRRPIEQASMLHLYTDSLPICHGMETEMAAAECRGSKWRCQSAMGMDGWKDGGVDVWLSRNLPTSPQ